MGEIGFQALPSQAASHVGMEVAMSLTRAGSQHRSSWWWGTSLSNGGYPGGKRGETPCVWVLKKRIWGWTRFRDG
jgi:hypothetical protein